VFVVCREQRLDVSSREERRQMGFYCPRLCLLEVVAIQIREA